MPDLNLQDEEGSLGSLESGGEDEISVTERGATDTGPEKKGSGVMALVVVVMILVVGAGGVYLLNQLGVIKLWGKKQAPQIAQVQEQQQVEQQAVATTPEQEQRPMIETPPLSEAAEKTSRGGDKVSSVATKPPKQTALSAKAPVFGEMKGDYTVQVCAFNEASTADEMLKRLQEAGYPAFIEQRAYKSGKWYTVRVGRYPSRKDAQLAVQSFAEELKESYWIDKVRGN